MKTYIKNILLLTMSIIVVGAFLTSCEEEELPNGGKPFIEYIRTTNPDSPDSLVTGAFLGDLIVIKGGNLSGARKAWFNDREALLTSTFITSTSILVTVPNKAPLEEKDELTLIFADGSSLVYTFKTLIPPPDIQTMDAEYVADGEVAYINGNYFYDILGPVEVFFTGPGETLLEAEVLSTAEDRLSVTVPTGSVSGPITVTTTYGSSESKLHFRDERGIFLNFDDLTAAGSWRSGVLSNAVDPLDGNYLVLGGPTESLNANDRIEDPFECQFWGATRYPEPTNLVQGIAENQVLKFEARVVEWNESYLQMCWAPYGYVGNQEIWSNDYNGRGIWGPWEESSGSFSTDGKWITVVTPLSEMKYSHGQEGEESLNYWKPDMTFDKNNTGNFTFWVVATRNASDSPVEIHIDNVRIVEK